MVLQSVVVVCERGQIEERIDQQEQQQSQDQRQAPVVGDQHLIAASLQEGAAPSARLLLHVGQARGHFTQLVLARRPQERAKRKLQQNELSSVTPLSNPPTFMHSFICFSICFAPGYTLSLSLSLSLTHTQRGLSHAPMHKTTNDKTNGLQHPQQKHVGVPVCTHGSSMYVYCPSGVRSCL